MASIRRKLEKKGVIAMTLLTLVLIGTSCEDKIDSPVVDPSEGKMVEVSLNIGFTNEEDGYALGTKSGVSSDKGVFSCELQPTAVTKGDVSVKPDQLYNLEIQQYDQSGKRIGGMESAETKDIGSAINVTLKQTSDNDGCQLVIVAWGNNTTTTRLGTSKTLKEIQKLFIDASVINSIPTSDMNKMPYVLHLKHVKVENNTIKSLDGHDVRLLLKRLATRLTIKWTYNVSGFTLNQIILRSIPLNYNVVAAPDEKETYPSLLDQYTNIQLSTEEEIKKGSYSCWIPANVRGFNTASNSPLYRIKANAPTGSAYATFIAKSNLSGSKEKLDYRVYLGGKDYSDFNLYGNTDYSYTVNFSHEGIPVNDYRVTYINPISASENNENFVNTANCFMVAPGGAFCFNPYKYYINGEVKDNTLLQGWCNSSSPIQYVKVLWQTLENGDLGDPVLGTVNAPDDHVNIIDIKYGDDFANARIYCRVAPNTTGGSGVIAAYDKDNKILWSWHIWVTDYAPDAKANESVDDTNKRVQKYTYNGKEQNPMMDRNLGAIAGYTKAPDDDLAKSKANGFHYQYGRKDPFPSTYSSNLSSSTISINATELTPGMLNYYQPDGISYYVRTTVGSATSIQGSFQNPTTTYSKGVSWCSSANDYSRWSDKNNSTVKTVYDPCPAGWRVAGKANYLSLFTDKNYTESETANVKETMNITNTETAPTDGGVVVCFEHENAGRSTYIRMTGYQPNDKTFEYIGELANLWCRESNANNSNYMLSIVVTGSLGQRQNISNKWYARDSHPLRCIQDRDSQNK